MIWARFSAVWGEEGRMASDWVSRRSVALAVIVACGLAVFYNTLGNSFHYDDEHSIVENPHIRSLENVPRFFVDPGTFSGLPEARMYRPLLLVTYALNYALGGYGVFGYHLVNLLLHLANACLLWIVAGRLLGKGWGALLAGLLFAVHPLASEPVNYISSRSSLLATLFLLLAFLLLVRAGERKCGWKQHGWIAVCYLAALLSKSIAIVFPLIGAAYLLLVAQRKIWKCLALPAVISLLYLAGTRAIVGKALLQPVRGYGAHLATQIKAAVFYVWKMAVPTGLSVEPQFRVADGFGDGTVVLAGFALASSIFAIWSGRRQKRLLAFALVWFLLALLPSSLAPLYVLVNEHRLYLPMAGAAVGVGLLADGGGRRLSVSWVFVLLFLGILCFQRHVVWKSEESLWGDAVVRGGHMARPYINLGKAYLEQGRYREAIEVSRRGLDIDPGLARAYYNIGTGYLQLENYELAEAYYQSALERQPDLIQAHNNLGNAYLEQGLPDRAEVAYRKALGIQENPSLYHNLANAFMEQGEVDSARVYFRRVLELDPEMREAYKGLIKVCLKEERVQTALEVARDALERWPGDETFLLMQGDAHATLGQREQAVRAYRRAGRTEVQVWLQLGHHARQRQDWDRAREHYERALAADGDEARVHDALGQIRYRQGDVSGALQAFRQAAQLDPGDYQAYAHIGRVHLQRGGVLEAIAALQRAVELAPEDGEVRGLLADAYQRGGKDEKAIQTYQKAVELAPGKAEFYHNLGFAYAQGGHWKEAERMYRAALQRDGQLVEALFNLGYLCLEGKRFAEAAERFQAVIELDPGRESGYLNLASAWLGQGELEKAIDVYSRFLELHGEDDELRRRTIAQLRKLRVESGMD